MVNPGNLEVPTLGPCAIESPLQRHWAHAQEAARFVSDEDKILVDDALKSVSRALARNEPLAAFESAGPRRKIFFDPAKACCAIVTCGGLCPGLNDVIRGLVLQAYDRYGVRKVYGIRCGYEGLIKAYGHPVSELTPDDVKNIHMLGGSVLGTSRGPQDPREMVNKLGELGVNALFIIGGDGTLRGGPRLRPNRVAVIIRFRWWAFLRPSITTSCSPIRASATRPRAPQRLRQSKWPTLKRARFATGSAW